MNTYCLRRKDQIATSSARQSPLQKQQQSGAACFIRRISKCRSIEGLMDVRDWLVKDVEQEVMALNLYIIVANKKKAKEKDYAENIPSFISLNPSWHPRLQQMCKYKVKLCPTKICSSLELAKSAVNLSTHAYSF